MAYLGAFSGSTDAEVIISAFSVFLSMYSDIATAITNKPVPIAFFRSGAWGFYGIAWIRANVVSMTVTQEFSKQTYIADNRSGSVVVQNQPTRDEIDALNSKLSYTNIISGLSGGDLFNSQPGSYWISRAANTPEGFEYGYFDHIQSGADPVERIVRFQPYNNPSIFYIALSTNSGNTWSSWYKYTGTKVD